MARYYGGQSKYLRKNILRYTFITLGIAALLFVFWFFIFVKNFSWWSSLGATGIFVFFGAIFLLKLLMNFTDSIEKKADKFSRGAEGETKICRELKKLPDSYCVFEDINLYNRGNTDFVVVGPTGIFTIEVKSHNGEVGFNGQELLRDGRPFEKDFLKQAMDEALDLHGYLKEKMGRDLFINPVVVFSGYAKVRFDLNRIRNVFVIGKAYLRKLFFSQQEVFTNSEVDLLEKSLMPLTVHTE